MSEAGRCESCNASVAAGAERCEYCGAALPVAVPAPAPIESAHRDSLQVLAAKVDLDALRPSREMLAVPFPVLQCIVGVMFMAIPAFMIVSASGMRASGIFMALPAVFVVVGAVIAGSSIRTWTKRRGTELRPHHARVVGRRSEIRSSGKSVRTVYHVTLGFPRGRRNEYEIAGRLYGRLAEDDVGIAWIRGNWLSGFERREV